MGKIVCSCCLFWNILFIEFLDKTICCFILDGEYLEDLYRKGFLRILNDNNWFERVVELIYLIIIKSIE